MIDLESSAPARGERELLAVVRTQPQAPVALHALMLRRGEALTRGEDPDGLLEPIAADPTAAAVLEGWRRSRAGRLAQVVSLEPALAATIRHEPLYEPALRLRLGWRLASGDPGLAREAIGLLDPFMADAVRPFDSMLRARLALAAGDAPTAYSSLLEIADAGLYVSDYQQTAREGIKLLEVIESTTGTQAPEGLRERLLRGSEGPPLP
jgi:hypothetical protein